MKRADSTNMKEFEDIVGLNHWHEIEKQFAIA